MVVERRVAGLRQVADVGIHVARDEKIEAAVAVVVGPGGADAEATGGEMIFFGDVLEFAATEIVVKHVVSVAGDVNVGKAVVIVIADGDTHAPAESGEAGGFRDVSKVEIAVLMIERDHRIAAVEVAADGGVGDGDDVELAIAVAIEERDAAAHHFDEVAFVGVEVGDGGETGL